MWGINYKCIVANKELNIGKLKMYMRKYIIYID